MAITPNMQVLLHCSARSHVWQDNRTTGRGVGPSSGSCQAPRGGMGGPTMPQQASLCCSSHTGWLLWDAAHGFLQMAAAGCKPESRRQDAFCQSSGNQQSLAFLPMAPSAPYPCPYLQCRALGQQQQRHTNTNKQDGNRAMAVLNTDIQVCSLQRHGPVNTR
jgi:hypothetical protein